VEQEIQNNRKIESIEIETSGPPHSQNNAPTRPPEDRFMKA